MKGVSTFKKRLLELAGNNYAGAINSLINDVKKSGVKNIAFKNFKSTPVAGVSKGNGDVFIADKGLSFSDIMFITLHELAHQLQYKKYGNEYSLNLLYNGYTTGVHKISSEIKEIEDVANRYAFIKFKKYQSMFGLPNISYHIRTGTYMPQYAYEGHLTLMFQDLRCKGVNSKEEMRTQLNNFLN